MSLPSMTNGTSFIIILIQDASNPFLGSLGFVNDVAETKLFEADHKEDSAGAAPQDMDI